MGGTVMGFEMADEPDVDAPPAASPIGPPGPAAAKSPQSAPDPGRLIGRRLGAYRIVRLLGIGSRGAVYEAEDVPRGRSAALRLLPLKTGAAQAAARQLLFRDAEALSRVDHANVAAVFSAAADGDAAFVATELLPGGSVEERLGPGGRLPPGEAARLAAAVARGLSAAHAAGVLHRDVHPRDWFSNGRGGVKLAGFGIARLSDGLTGVSTTPDAVVGLPLYMSPERGLGHELDARADIYSLGAACFRVLAGAPPFEGAPMEILHKHLFEAHPDPRTREPSIPAGWVRIIDRALAKDPARRFASAADMAAALEALAAPPGA